MNGNEIYTVTDPLSRLSRKVKEGVRISSTGDVWRVYQDRILRSDVWVSDQPELFRDLKGGEVRGSTHRLLLLEAKVDPQRLDFLRSWFRQVEVYGDDSPLQAWLPSDELLEALSAERRDELVIRITVDREDEVVTLLRGNLERLVIPMDWFTRGKPAQEPDFSKPGVTDYGQTLEFGDYDVAVEAILYEYDPEVRRAQKERELEMDDSFGASLRRLRLQKGLNQSDFDPVTARQIRRIEKGETESPRSETLEVIAERLGVKTEEIRSY